MWLPLTITIASLLTEGVQSILKVDWEIPIDRKPYDPVTATVGETITFSYSLGHNVLIHPSGTCDNTDALYLGSTSPTEYAFEKEGMYTFVCGVGDGLHCGFGQIISVNVTGTSDGGDEAANEDKEDESSAGEDKEDGSSTVGEDKDKVLEKYSDFFNPGEEMGLLEFRMQPYKVPRVITKYTDFLFHIPDDFAEIVHIVTGDVIVSQPKHLHHFVINGCTEPIDPSQNGLPVNDVPRSCSIPLGGWAVGGGLFDKIPSDSGYAFGPALGVKALSLNVHYTDGLDIDTNYANDGTNAIATDGIRILYTPNLRPQTALYKPLINAGSGPRAMSLPANIPRYFYTKTCTVQPSCQDSSDELMKKYQLSYTCGQVKDVCSSATGFVRTMMHFLCPEACGLCGAKIDEYHISAVTYHAHLLGREMYTTLLPKGGDAPIDLESKDSWIFDYQATYQFRDDQHSEPFYKVYTGDKIQATCVYDSTARTRTTQFDVSTYDEMCITQVIVLVDTPDFTSDTTASMNLVLNYKSFSCALDDSSDIWGGSLDAEEDARDIWTNRPMTEADCTFPVGSLFGNGLSVFGDTTPNFEANCGSKKYNGICDDDVDGVIFDKDARAGDYCSGGSMDSMVSNDPSRYGAKDDSTFKKLCSQGGGEAQTYTCEDAEEYLNGSESAGAPPERLESMRVIWWQPPCCSVKDADKEQEEEEEEEEEKEVSSDASSDASKYNGICDDDVDGVIFDKDARAGDYCSGGSMDGVVSNDPSRYGAKDDSTFKKLCSQGGGEAQTYTCKDAEEYLNGSESAGAPSERLETMRVTWWQPPCCSVKDVDKEQEEEEEEEKEVSSDASSDASGDTSDNASNKTPDDNPNESTDEDEEVTSGAFATSQSLLFPCILFHLCVFVYALF